jgi:hypothetical protein
MIVDVPEGRISVAHMFIVSFPVVDENIIPGAKVNRCLWG